MRAAAQLRRATTDIVTVEGEAILRQPYRFVDLLAEAVEGNEPELEAMYEACDYVFLSPFAEAADAWDPDAYEEAAQAAAQVLVEATDLSEASALQISRAIARGVGDALAMPVPQETMADLTGELEDVEVPGRHLRWRRTARITGVVAAVVCGSIIGAVIGFVLGGGMDKTEVTNAAAPAPAADAQTDDMVTELDDDTNEEDDSDDADSSDGASVTSTGNKAKTDKADEKPATKEKIPASYQSSALWLPTKQSFWGVWTIVSDDFEDCEAHVGRLRAKGYNAYITNTSLWSNLVDESCYVVTTGTYASQEEALKAMNSVQRAGWWDAYTKYSGDYEG